MKLIKTFAIVFLAFILFSATGCTNNFCSDEEATAIKVELREMLDTNTGTGVYLQPEDWGTKTEVQKVEYVDKLYSTNHPKSCIVLTETNDPTTGVPIAPKTWSFGFSRGLIEGLLVFPISMALAFVTQIIGSTGIGQVLSIIIVTFAVRALTMLVSLKSTVASQKLQMLQPELNAIQAKYAGSKDQSAKNMQAQEMMALYKKHKINPLSSLVAPFLTLPIFIAVYGAVQSTMVLRMGSIFGVTLGETLSSGILLFNPFSIILFLIMVGVQYVAMKLPSWLAKKSASNRPIDARTRNAKSQQDTMTYVMMIMMVVIGWMLPIAMTVYWIASSLYTILQTYLFRNKAAHV